MKLTLETFFTVEKILILETFELDNMSQPTLKKRQFSVKFWSTGYKGYVSFKKVWSPQKTNSQKRWPLKTDEKMLY